MVEFSAAIAVAVILWYGGYSVVTGAFSASLLTIFATHNHSAAKQAILCVFKVPIISRLNFIDTFGGETGLKRTQTGLQKGPRLHHDDFHQLWPFRLSSVALLQV